MSPHRIWLEDLLQTASVRFHRSNDLTRYFDIGSGRAYVRETFDPGASWVHYSRLTHEFCARPAGGMDVRKRPDVYGAPDRIT